MKEKILLSAKKHFKPEFLNRLDGLVTFKPLDKEALAAIVDLEVQKLQQRLVKKQIQLQLTAEAKAFLIDKGYVPEMGARPLRRIVEQHLEDPLSEKILKGSYKKSFFVTIQNGELVIEEDPILQESLEKTPEMVQE
jgi:ATP-dependent Clp protease ATP-binding subunit ClpC